MGLSIISSNTTIKSTTGGSFRTLATTNILTTVANEYATVSIAGTIRQTSAGGGNSLVLTVNGVTIRNLDVASSGDVKTFSVGELATLNASTSVDGFIDIIVPPSASLDVTKNGAQNVITVVGTYQKFINTP